MLSLDGQHTTNDIADVLGTTRGTVQSIRQTVRRKLAVPPHVDLGWFVSSVPQLQELVANRPAVAAAPAPSAERRTRSVLRSALRELQDLADRTASRASALAALAVDGVDDAMGDEVRALQAIATSLEAVSVSALEQARTA